MKTCNMRRSVASSLVLRVTSRLICLATVLCIVTAVSGAEDTSELEAGFGNPPRQARPMVWWHWVSANVSKEGIRADLEDKKRCGIGGAQMFDVDLYQPHGPVRYNTDAWHEHIQYAIKVADE